MNRNCGYIPRSLLILALSVLVLAGCGSMATRKNFYEPIIAQVRTGEFDSVVMGMETARQEGKYGAKDRVVYYIDAGMAYHYALRYDTSNVRLQAAEAAAEELFTRSISKAALSLVLNDNALDYAGEDYEILYTNLIGALNYLALDDFDNAFVEIRRANLKLEQLNKKYAEAARIFQRGALEDKDAIQIDYEAKPVRFHNSAFARYLSMHMYAAAGKFADADLDYELLLHAFENQPYIYDFAPPEVVYTSDEGGVLSVVALAGLSPVKEALSLRLRTDKDLDLVQILYDDPELDGAEYGHLPLEVSEDYYFKFAIPRLVDRPTRVAAIAVFADGRPVGQLQMLEDVGAVARDTFEAKKSLIYLRSVARAVVKGLIAHKQKEKADTGGLGGWLKKAAIDLVTDLTENADLRCARLLPGYVYVGDFILPEGRYNITVEYRDTDGRLIESYHYPGYYIKSGNFNLLQTVSTL